MAKELDYLLNGSLDVNNIRAHSITAETLNVDELSAISANLGTITAGIINGIQIYGSYIATSNGTYPRCEMSATGNVFAAYLDANNYITIEPDYGGSPSVNFFQGGVLKGRINTLLGDLEVYGANGIEINGNGFVRVYDTVNFDNFSKIRSTSPSTDLQTALNNKATSGASTSSAGGVTLNGGIPIGTSLATSGGGSVTWAGITVPSHTHTQN
jgi:hypothetical protein